MSQVVEAVHESYAKDRRARVLAAHFGGLIPRGSRVLDVGTGDGSIAAAVIAGRPDIEISGLEFQVRESCAIPVQGFDGESIPFPDNHFDFISFLDVLHHTHDPMVLLREACRVARRGLIIKDHLKEGCLAGRTLAFMDRVGNRRYGIDLPNTYWTRAEWESAWKALRLEAAEWREALGIYPAWADWVFGRRLHFFARMEFPDPEAGGGLEFRHPGLSCCNERWESAYNRFETAEEERAKFRSRFREMGIDRLPRETRIVDLFCGRGNGLRVLEEWGFTHLTGVDLSPELLRKSPAGIDRIVADCTDLRFAEKTVDVFIVQGGLHHLPRMPEDLDRCLEGVHRALKPGGVFYVVEPWDTPFLRLVHAVTRTRLARRLVPRFDAFATMVEEEWQTYSQWLRSGPAVLASFRARFPIVKVRKGWGKCRLIVQKEKA
jgi:SAM-dependent methyltransferase